MKTILLLLITACTFNLAHAEEKKTMTEKATFAAGCFWGVQSTFDEIPGVLKTTVGYAGGHTDHPGYWDVASRTTGHAESILIEFDPAKVSYKQLVEIFWELHDPTQLNRQGPDIGDEYRSAIFYHSPEQKKIAEESKAALDKKGVLGKPIVTQIVPAAEFYPAEDYHQKYNEKQGIRGCHVRIKR